MKNSIETFSLLLVLLILATNSFASNYFVAASITDNAVGYTNTSAPLNIGCDAMATTLSGGGALTVTVAENNGGSVIFAWEDYNGSAWYTALQYSDVTDPDIVMVNDQNNPMTCYALILYYSPGQGNIYLEEWTWGGTTFSQTNVTTVASVVPTAVNIDANYYGDFVITWDNSGNGNIYVWGGSTGTGTPTLSASGAATITSPTGKYPDVAIHDDRPNVTSTNFNFVILTYVSANNQILYKGQEPVNSVMSGSFSNTPTALLNTGTAAILLFNPRVAAASDLPDPFGFFDVVPYWAVVIEQIDATSSTVYDILSFFSSGNCIYTDNSGGLGTINTFSNYRPVVSFDQVNSGVIVSWISAFPNEHANFIEDAPVALQVKPDDGTALSSQIMVVPRSNLNQAPNQQLPVAVAGRFDKDMFYSWYDDSNSSISYKYANISASNLRYSQLPAETMGRTYPNPFFETIHLMIPGISANEVLNVSLMDNTGRLLLNEKVEYFNLSQEINNLASTLVFGSYCLKVSSQSNNNLINQQIIKM